jgi:hypothetical protein
MLQLYLSDSQRSMSFRQQLMFKVKCKFLTKDMKFIEHSSPLTWAEDYLVAATIQDIKQSHQFRHSGDRLDEVFTEFIALGECLGLESIQISTTDINQRIRNR